MILTVEHNQNLTPLDEEKDVFLIRFSYSEPLRYQPGDWLTIQPQNPAPLVAMVLNLLTLDGSEKIEVKRVGEISTQEALNQHLELTQLNPSILNKLQRQYQIGNWADRNEMIDYAYGRDIVDLLESFPVLQQMREAFLQLLSPLAPRHYSIASSIEVIGEQSVDLLYKQVRYHRAGRERLGVATTHLSDLQAGDQIEGRLVENKAFKLNLEASAIILVGAGTGAAPYIGFLQQIEALAPKRMADTYLFFGETAQKTSFLFENHLKDWQQKGLQLNTAFSRDQAEKIYVQDLLWQQKEKVWVLLEQGANFYLCGDKAGMASGVENTLLEILREVGGIAHPESVWKEWKKSRKVQYDVY